MGLTLPFSETLNLGDTAAFEITSRGGGGTAVRGEAYGTSSKGNLPVGVHGVTDTGVGVHGVTDTGVAVMGEVTTKGGPAGALAGQFSGPVQVSSPEGRAITANSASKDFDTVYVTSSSSQHAAISANNLAPIDTGTDAGNGSAIWANSNNTAIYANSNSQNFDAVYVTSSSSLHAAISANNVAPVDSGTDAGNGSAIWANSNNTAIYANSNSQNFDAVYVTSASSQHAAISANNTAEFNGTAPSSFALWASSNGTAIYGQGQPAGFFAGDVQVTGDLILINSPASGDVAEDFDMGEDSKNSEPGTVVVINSSGKLSACMEMYDTRVAGVLSGAGKLKPALVLQRLETQVNRSPLALIGKVFCKVDASFGSIAAGDLLTTSPTPGHAMKVLDKTCALGAILGKALEPLESGAALICILVSLR
jgi:hypothetical protein